VGCSENPQHNRFKDSMISVIILFGHRIKYEVLYKNFIREGILNLKTENNCFICLNYTIIIYICLHWV
jgi:hypothetical protein